MATFSSVDPRRALLAVASSMTLGVGGLFLGFALFLLATVGVLLAGLEFGPTLQLGLGLITIQGVGCVVVATAYIRYSDRLSAYVTDRLELPGTPRQFAVHVSVPDLRDVVATVLSWIGALVGGPIVAGSVGSLILARTEEEAGQSGVVETGLQQPELLLWLIPAMILIVGPGEELLFRGVVQGRLREVFSAPVAIVGAGVPFAALHWFGFVGGTAGGNLILVAVLLVPSLVFGVSYEYTNNLFVPALAHGLYNSVLLALLYVSVTYMDEFEEAGETAATLVAAGTSLL